MAVQITTFADLWGERLDRELGSEDRAALFTTARRKAAVNEAALEWVKQTESFVKQTSLVMVNATREYDVEASAVLTADDFLWVAAQGVEWAFTDANGAVAYRAGDDFPRKDIPVLNRENPGWRNGSASEFPSSWYLRRDGGKTYFGLSEPPAITAPETAAVTLPYVAKPLTLTADADGIYAVSADALEVLEPWLQAIAHYAAALLEPLRKNYQAEQRQRTLFAAQVADYLQRQRPKGGQRIQVSRAYYRDARGGAVSRTLDPRIY
jgi:hypothetical protein